MISFECSLQKRSERSERNLEAGINQFDNFSQLYITLLCRPIEFRYHNGMEWVTNGRWSSRLGNELPTQVNVQWCLIIYVKE